MIKIDGTAIEASYVEYGILWDDGEVTPDMTMAEVEQAISLETGAKGVARKVYETAWADVEVSE